MVQRGHDAIVQILVCRSDSSDKLATWEDKEALRQLFPCAPAWGQAVSKEAVIVNDQEEEASVAKEMGKKQRQIGHKIGLGWNIVYQPV
jgi:hypothetical protein